jgi:cytoskeletal protein CcmA (bactofilin family)
MSLFSKKTKTDLDQQTISTLISEGCVLEGNLKAPKFIRIDGQVNGDVEAEEGLILGEKGMVTGNIITRQMVNYGTIKGNIHVETLDIRSTGKINGEIKTSALQVEMGAIYNGNLSMA